jgi:hypothetical protein
MKISSWLLLVYQIIYKGGILMASACNKKTPGFSGSCAESQNRTVDTAIFSRMLYQLS